MLGWALNEKEPTTSWLAVSLSPGQSFQLMAGLCVLLYLMGMTH
jgi:hypothetical protein